MLILLSKMENGTSDWECNVVAEIMMTKQQSLMEDQFMY